MDAEQLWLDNRAIVQAAISELLDAGFSLAVARQLAGWNSSYEYDSYADLQSGTPGPEFSASILRLAFSRAAARVNSNTLQGAVLDAGKLYAVYIPDVPELGINFITFKLNGVNVHTEFSAPWDYSGTSGGGDANRVTFVAGSHSIEAEINSDFGSYSLEASFDVE